MRWHSSACTCRDCVQAAIWRNAVWSVAAVALLVTFFIVLQQSGLFAWLSN